MKNLEIMAFGKSYNLPLEDDFAARYQDEIKEALDRCVRPEQIIEAYLKKMYDYYSIEKKLEQIISKTQNV